MKKSLCFEQGDFSVYLSKTINPSRWLIVLFFVYLLTSNKNSSILFQTSNKSFILLDKKPITTRLSVLVEEGGFEPPKRNATDLQSAPFGHSGTPPYEIVELVDGFEPPTC